MGPGKKLDWSNNVKTGLMVLGVLLLLFGIWFLFIPLESAAIANGTVVVSKHRKSIQSLDGGTVLSIFVNEGTKVSKGTPLIKLDDTQYKIQEKIYLYELDQLYAAKARITAQLEGASQISFPKAMLQRQSTEPKIKEILTLQQANFQSQIKAVKDQMEVADQKIEKLRSSIASFEKRLVYAKKQLQSYEAEEKQVIFLRSKQLVSMPRLLNLQRERDKLQENIQMIEGSIEESKKEILQTLAEKNYTSSNYISKLTDELTQTQSKILEAENKLDSVRKKLTDSLVVSPEDGIILDLQVHTIGGVVKPGEVMMQLVPMEDQLLIEARINPLDIDIIQIGAIVRVDFLPYSSRRYPLFTGRLKEIAADVLVDERSKVSFYKAYIEIPLKEIKNYPDLRLYPGIPVVVYIVHEKRTLWNYLITPLERSYQDAFRED